MKIFVGTLPPSYNLQDSFILPEEFETYDYIAHQNSDSSYSYFYTSPYNGSRIATPIRAFRTVTDCQMQVFITCTTQLHEIAPCNALCEKYHISPEKLTSSLYKALHRAPLSEFQITLATKLFIHRIPKRELIKEYSLSNLRHCSDISMTIRHFCRNEYEKRYLAELLDEDYNAGEGFFIGFSTAAEILGITKDFAEKAIMDVINNQSAVEGEKLDFVKRVIFGNISQLTIEEQNEFSSLANSIIKFYRDEEENLYNTLADNLIKKGSFTQDDLEDMCAAHNIHLHELLYALFRKGYKRPHPRHRKRLKDWLDDK